MVHRFTLAHTVKWVPRENPRAVDAGTVSAQKEFDTEKGDHPRPLVPDGKFDPLNPSVRTYDMVVDITDRS